MGDLRCDFINTEINHDLGKKEKNEQPITKKIHERPNFLKASRRNIITDCHWPNDTPLNPDGSPYNFYNDYDSFKNVVQFRDQAGVWHDCSFNHLKQADLDPNTSEVLGNYSSKVYARNAQNKPITDVDYDARDVKIYRFNEQGENRGVRFTEFDNQQLLAKAFVDNCEKEYLNDVDITNIYFVIDTGDKVPKVILDSLNRLNTDTVNLNVLHSPLTLGDSAPKTKPFANAYKKLNRSIGGMRERGVLSAWLWLGDIVIPENDPLFLSRFRIETEMAVNPLRVRQNWKTGLGGPTIYDTYNPKKENNKPTVKAWLTSQARLDEVDNWLSLQNGDEADPTVIGNDYHTHKVSLNVQKKRSGDHLQIWFAKNAHDFLATSWSAVDLGDGIPVIPNKFTFCNPKQLQINEFSQPVEQFDNNGLDTWRTDYPRRPYVVEQREPTQVEIDRIKETYKKNTFFVTGDWPAAAYAVYHKVNTIMFFKHPKNREETFFLIFFIN